MLQLSKYTSAKLAAILISGSPCFLSAAQINGIVYGESGGPFGAGTGEVRIATEQCIFDLSYQKPFPQRFASEVCHDVGAFWTVEGKITHPGMGTLEYARCDGRYDASIHSAWMTAKQFLKLAGSHAYEAANGLRSSRAIQSGLKEDLVKLENLDLESYLAYGGAGNCLSVRVKDDDKAVAIQAGNTCLIKQNGQNVSLTLRVVDEGSQKGWRIDKMRVC
jgi:hypothetical protein